jgi:ubiquinol-cytochrome c reductase cytochrome b subunit
VFFTGAFRRPRRLNWIDRRDLMGLAMTTGFFGLSLPHDLLGGTGSRVGHAFAVSIPVIGPGVADLLFAGEFGNPDMLHRFWLLHVWILPILIAAHLGGHLLLVWLQTHTQFSGGRRTERNVVGSRRGPVTRSRRPGCSGSCPASLLVMGARSRSRRSGSTARSTRPRPPCPPSPTGTSAGSRVRCGSCRRSTSWCSGTRSRARSSPAWCSVRSCSGALPLAVRRGTAHRDDSSAHHLLDRPRDHPVRTSLGVGGLLVLIVLQLAGSHDLQALLIGVPVDRVTTAYRVLVLVVPPGRRVRSRTRCAARSSAANASSGGRPTRS